MTKTLISAEIKPVPQKAEQAALALQRLGFRILHIGLTISVQGPSSLWESIFNVAFETKHKVVIAEVEKGEVTYQRALTEKLRIPPELIDLVEEVHFVEPPEFY